MISMFSHARGRKLEQKGDETWTNCCLPQHGQSKGKRGIKHITHVDNPLLVHTKVFSVSLD